MESITAFEKVKNPIVSLIGGLLLGGYVTWNSVATLHEERVKILETSKVELERQVAIRNKTIEEKDIELKDLYSKLSSKPIVSAVANVKPGNELRNLIAQLDIEIDKKKQELSRNAGLSVASFDGKRESPKSEAYIRIERELLDLNEQRNLARQKLVDTLSK